MNKEDLGEKFIIGFFILIAGGMLIAAHYMIGKTLIEEYGKVRLLFIPVSLILIVTVGWVFKLIFPKATIYDKER